MSSKLLRLLLLTPFMMYLMNLKGGTTRKERKHPSRRLDLASLGSLVFQPPAHDRFPALNLAIGSMRSGGLAPTVLNAANEIAVQAFLERRIGFLDIPRVVAQALDGDYGSNGTAGDLDSVLGTDARARVLAEEICQRVGT